MNRLYFYANSHRIFFWCFLLCFAAQVGFWLKTEKFHPPIQIVPEAPSETVATAMSFGDKEYLFRIFGMRMMNSGDVFAGFAPLLNYDYFKLYRWMKILDSLNNTSFSVPYIASYYYSSVPDPEKNRHIVKYLDEFASQNPKEKWMFFSSAAIISKIRIKDLKLAQEEAKKLSVIDDNPKIPIIHRQLYAFISEEIPGESCTAYNEMKRIDDLVQSGKIEADSKERAFIKFFLQYRAFKMDNGKFNPKKCRAHSKN